MTRDDAIVAEVPLTILDLFSGARGWTAPFDAAGHFTFSIDIDPRFRADAHLDIGDAGLVLGALPWRPDYIFASPPCNSFSTMTMGRMWTHSGEPKHPLAIEGRRLVLATLRIIAVLQPRLGWVIENPRARLRPRCKNGMSCHVAAPRGSTTGTQGMDSVAAATIPYALADAFRMVLEVDAQMT